MRARGRVGAVGKHLLMDGMLLFVLSLGVMPKAAAQESGDNLVMTRCIT